MTESSNRSKNPALELDEPVELDEDIHGFVERDLYCCIKVLNCLSEPENRFLIQKKQFQPLRDAFLAFNRSYSASQHRGKGIPVVGERKPKGRAAKSQNLKGESQDVVQDATRMRKLKMAEKMLVREALETELHQDDEEHKIPSHVEFSTRALLRAPENRDELISSELDTYDQEREEMYSSMHDPKPLTSSLPSEKTELDPEKKKKKELLVRKKCYICKSKDRNHWFYDSMCSSCGDFNYKKRTQTCDLTGRVFLVTGGRIKIGYKIVLILLRNGARVVMTTRFPKEAAIRFAKEEDAATWSSRLEIYGLDLRYIPGVVSFCSFLKRKLSRLDGIINNAAQTVRKPPIFHEKDVRIESTPPQDLDEIARKLLPEGYKMNLSLAGIQDDEDSLKKPLKLLTDSELKEEESESVETTTPASSSSSSYLPMGINSYTSPSAILSQIPLEANDALLGTTDFPEVYDSNGQRVDLRKSNSWKMELDEVGSPELIEVHMVNAFAPYLICGHLKSLMVNTPDPKKFIVNVTAMEGCFYRPKTTRHPHTNMAKASLNMMTRTSGPYYAKAGIQMTCADTGWVTDENPRAHEIQDFTVPLDEIDGAMRVLDPIFSSINDNEFYHTVIFKDYKPFYW